MTLPIHRILWAGNDSRHNDHLHVEGVPYIFGKTTGEGTQPPPTNPGMTTAIRAVWDAMTVQYGKGYYFLNPEPPEPNWSNMGIYNRRPISGSTTWSQHAYGNALDIGPLYGVSQQLEIYEYLTKGEEMTEAQMAELKAFVEDRLNVRFGAPITIPGEPNRPSNQGIVNGVHHAYVNGEKAMNLLYQAAKREIPVDFDDADIAEIVTALRATLPGDVARAVGEALVNG